MRLERGEVLHDEARLRRYLSRLSEVLAGRRLIARHPLQDGAVGIRQGEIIVVGLMRPAPPYGRQIPLCARRAHRGVACRVRFLPLQGHRVCDAAVSIDGRWIEGHAARVATQLLECGTVASRYDLGAASR